jgi:hypothetical protein
MIDYLSLALGHGLLAIALLRLVMRKDLDEDPRIAEYAAKAEAIRAKELTKNRSGDRTARRHVRKPLHR